MKPIAAAAIAAFSLTITGCTPRYTWQDDRGTALPARVLEECQYEADKASAGTGSIYAIADGIAIKNRCLRLRGYELRAVQR